MKWKMQRTRKGGSEMSSHSWDGDGAAKKFQRVGINLKSSKCTQNIFNDAKRMKRTFT